MDGFSTRNTSRSVLPGSRATPAMSRVSAKDEVEPMLLGMAATSVLWGCVLVGMRKEVPPWRRCFFGTYSDSAQEGSWAFQ